MLLNMCWGWRRGWRQLQQVPVGAVPANGAGPDNCGVAGIGGVPKRDSREVPSRDFGEVECDQWLELLCEVGGLCKSIQQQLGALRGDGVKALQGGDQEPIHGDVCSA